jgi:hypothetical protein
MGGSELTNKVLGYAERNVTSAFEFAQRLVQVRDIPGLMSLQGTSNNWLWRGAMRVSFVRT